MSTNNQSVYPDQYYQSYPPPRQVDESKSTYDDLVDSYATPYSKTSQHQTFSVSMTDSDPASKPPDHVRRPSFPALTQKVSYSSTIGGKASDETLSDPVPRGYPPAQPEVEVDERTFWQKILPESIACRLYVIIVVVQTTIDLLIEGELLLRFHEVKHDSSDGRTPDQALGAQKMRVYLGVFALAHVFQFVLAVDAVYAKNTLQFICLTIFNALFLAYAIIQIDEIRTTLEGSTAAGLSHLPVQALTSIIPIVISLAEIAYIALGWKIYNEFGWKVYKFLGADRQIKKMFANYQIFQCLVKFDVFFWIGFSVQFIWLVLNNDKNHWEYYVTCAALPLSIILLIEGHLGARHENKWMMATFMSGCVGAMIYFVYKLFRVQQGRNEQFLLVWKSLTTFSVIAICLLLVTFVFGLIVMRNFGRGLKTSLEKGREPPSHQRYPSKSPHQRAASTNRMTIE